uniref:Uncharacterized protein n=1 Tax=Cacopsylla melanoneura TaxID=428564 RepID=A0A8D8RXZ8_9HEMI
MRIPISLLGLVSTFFTIISPMSKLGLKSITLSPSSSFVLSFVLTRLTTLCTFLTSGVMFLFSRCCLLEIFPGSFTLLPSCPGTVRSSSLTGCLPFHTTLPCVSALVSALTFSGHSS